MFLNMFFVENMIYMFIYWIFQLIESSKEQHLFN